MDQGIRTERASARKEIPATRVRIIDGHRDLFGFARNISRSGMLIQTARPCNIGDEVSIEFSFLSMDVRCRSKIVWRQEPGRRTGTVREGVQFLDIDSSAAEKIDRWVQSLTN